MLSNMFQVYMAILYNYGDQNLIKLSIIDNILWKIPCQSYRVGSYSGSEIISQDTMLLWIIIRYS